MKYIIILLAALVGAVEIRSAIIEFKEGHYFGCGMFTMLSIWMASLLVKASVML